MTRTHTRTLAVSLLLAVAGLLMTGTASATTINDVASALRSNPVYVDQKATVQVDAGQIRDAIRSSGRHVYVAVLPQAASDSAGGAAALTTDIGRGLGDDSAILFTVAGSTVTGQAGGSSGLGRGQAQSIAAASGSGDYTAGLVRAVQSAGRAAASGPSSGSQPADNGSGGSSGSGGGAILGVLALIGLGGGGLLYARSRRRRQQGQRELQGSRADVESLYNRLGADVSNLSPGDDAVARQAVADAAERYNATGALLSKADTDGEFAAARRTVVEGLTAARLARTRLGLDPGPEIPPPPGSGPQLQAAERVQVDGQEYDGSPTYAPGRQHYFGGGYLGGQMVPGGWYGVPFWETMMIGSMMSGGGMFGGGYGGGMFGGGYGGGGFDRGYEEGVEAARDARDGGGYDNGGGGSSGGGGGGDWGGGGGAFSGGGDWGGGGGGGDWGGGGGGDSGGGSW